jgi:hypothetical protein
MLKFFSKVFSRTDKESLEQLAREISQNAINATRQMRRKNVKIIEYSSTLTLLETTKFVAQNIEYRRSNTLVAFSSFISSIALFQQGYSKEILHRTIVDDIILSYPFVTAIEKSLKYAGVSSKYLSLSVIGTFSSLQVMGLRLSHGFHTHSIIDFLLSSAAISVVHYATLTQVRALRRYFHFIPAVLIAFPIAYVSNNFVQRIGIYGIGNTFNYLLESLVSWILAIKSKDQRADSPIDTEIPPEMMCTICRDILKDPVESLGYFYCHDCMTRWVNNHHTHPGTGEPLSNENITKNFQMNAVVQQYRKVLGY